MEDKLLLGKNVADKIKSDISEKMQKLNSKNIFPTIATIRIGEKAEDIAYENAAEKVLTNLKIKVNKFVFPENVSQKTVEKQLEDLNMCENTHGILLFRPFPKHIDPNICNLISELKDVDCISKTSLGELFENKKDGKKPCTAQAVIEILKFYNIEIESKNIVVLGRSNVIGKPVAMMLTNENATVTLCHSKTANLKTICQNADILVCSIGKAHFVNSDFVKKGAVVIDVGINELDGKITGDVNFDDVIEKAAYITPVPRGVGSVTTTILAQNLLKCVDEILGDSSY